MQLLKVFNISRVVAIFAVAVLCACSNHDAQSRMIISEIKQQYGLDIVRLRDKKDLPSSVVFKMKDGEEHVEISKLGDRLYFTYLNILKRALGKYPSDLIKNTLTKVYIGGPYSENDAVIVGMYEKTNIYLFYNHKWGDNTPLFLEQTFHHEFSSILVKQYNFPAFDWLKLCPPTFSYIINPKKIDKYMNTVGSYAATESMLRDGVVSAYGMVNAENDINTYAETIFTQPEKMKEYIARYPVIAKKYKMLEKFYLDISPEFIKIFSLINK